MKAFREMLGRAFVFCVVMIVLCSFVYPLLLTGVSQLTMKGKANGNLINKFGEPTSKIEEAVGSALVGQQFTQACYFQGRVSSINYNTYTAEQKESGEYGGVSSGSFNYGNSNPALQERIQGDLDAFIAKHPGLTAENVPSDLLTASGSGLDPHISPKSAEIQIQAVAENSGLSEEAVRKIVNDNTEKKVLGIFGEEKVNVLKCNIDIANAMEALDK